MMDYISIARYTHLIYMRWREILERDGDEKEMIDGKREVTIYLNYKKH